MTFIPYARPVIEEEEILEVVDTLRSGWLTTGPKVAKFEKNFAEYIGCDFALAVSSATAGLHLALEALGVGPGDKVITTVHTFTATAEVIRYLGAEPVFVDIEPRSYCIDPILIEQALQLHENVKAIIPVHYAGQAADMAAIMDLAKKYSVKVVEDAAHALPCTNNGQRIGSIADVTVFSFYANKTITTGEGGMVTTNDESIAKRVKIMRLHGINRDAFDRFTSDKPNWYYEVVAPGYKYNMMDLCASIGIHQLKKADLFQQRRAAIAACYNAGFSSLAIILPQQIKLSDTHAWHIYSIQLQLEKLSITRNQFIEMMNERGIGTSVHYIPLHRMPYWRESCDLKDETFPVSSQVSNQHVSLPNFASMTDQEVQKVITVVCDIISQAEHSA
ncbi:MAG: degT/DnrJ/EryC1/StrS aminotransferase [Osedax symbiont Rs1]|nr:MAG: degT/DnrJ/EryC1/StrS aminotransferase [Osedax symbiont Rs1]